MRESRVMARRVAAALTSRRSARTTPTEPTMRPRRNATTVVCSTSPNPRTVPRMPSASSPMPRTGNPEAPVSRTWSDTVPSNRSWSFTCLFKKREASTASCMSSTDEPTLTTPRVRLPDGAPGRMYVSS